MRFQSKPESVLKQEEADRKSASIFADKSVVSFEVKTVVEKKSKSSGNDMFEIDLQTFDENGNRKQSVRDWIVPETQMYKLHQFCNAVGLEKKYDSGELTAFDMEGRCGKFVAGVEPSSDPQYPDRNKVRSYVDNTQSKPTMTKAESAADLDDDSIPF